MIINDAISDVTFLLVQSALQVGPTEVVSNPDNTDNTLLIHAIIWPTLAVFIIIVILAIILYSVSVCVCVRVSVHIEILEAM